MVATAQVALLLQVVGILLSLLIVLTGVLAYFSPGGMDEDEAIEAIARRLGNESPGGDYQFNVESVDYEPAESGLARLKNYFRHYPKGTVRLVAKAAGPGVSVDSPWDDARFEKLCEESGFTGVEYATDPVDDHFLYDVEIQVKVDELVPKRVDEFVEVMQSAMTGEPLTEDREMTVIT